MSLLLLPLLLSSSLLFEGEALPRNRTRRPLDAAVLERTQIRRFDNGTLKILYGSKQQAPARGSDVPDIVFPDNDYKKKKLTTSLRTNPCGDDLPYCENVAAYPQHLLDDILQNTASGFDDILGVDELDAGPIEIGQRNDFSITETMCKSIEKIIFPKVAMNKENKWLFVINQPKYEQGVRVELCNSENSPCLFSERFPNGYTATCKQKYIYRKMLALNENNGDTYTDLFRLPSCCSCSIKIPGDVGSRLGFDIGASSNMSPKKTVKNR